jgi:hypothetical protein
MIFLDTDVLIDCQRGLPAAEAWLKTAADQTFSIPGIVAMELVVGCRNKDDLRITQVLLNKFQIIWPTSNEIAQAFDLLTTYRLEFGVSIPDCIIAAMTLNHKVKLYTFNRKHYRMFPGLVIQEPYCRT